MKRLYNICSYCLKKERKYTLRPHCLLQPTYKPSPIEHGPRLYGTLAFTIQVPRQEDHHINLPKQPHPSSLNPPQNMSLLWNLCAKQSWKCSSVRVRGQMALFGLDWVLKDSLRLENEAKAYRAWILHLLISLIFMVKETCPRHFSQSFIRGQYQRRPYKH